MKARAFGASGEHKPLKGTLQKKSLTGGKSRVSTFTLSGVGLQLLNNLAVTVILHFKFLKELFYENIHSSQ